MALLLHRATGRIALIAAVALVGGLVPATTAQGAGDDVTFVGRGWGHGRGMGQYGALGYAVDHGWSAAQILDHFYGGTTAGNVGNPEMRVELLSLNGKPLVVTGPNLMVNGAPVGANAARFTVSGASVVAERGNGGCTSSWTPLGTFGANATRVRTSAPETSLDNMMRVCGATGERAYRGELSVVSSGGTQMTINHLPTESYLRGVVPRESPASWGTLGGGRGMQALMAQSVAARSYALASTRPTGAHTCDTTACQVYGGAGYRTGSWNALESPTSDAAIGSTAGVVRLKGGAVVRTEFSSSTGGYTAGGAFPAVPDDGDDTAYNPNHVWTASLTLSDVASRLGTGAIRSIAVTARNGLGADGGRATTVTVTATGGGVTTFTGNAVRVALGLKSDWFSISGMTLAEAQSIVRALYEDILRRSVDAGGLNTWSAMLAGGAGQPALVAALTSSQEYIQLRIAQAYEDVLLRSPDPGGMAHWVQEINARRASVDDVQRRFYDSAEFYNRSGGTPEGFVDLLYRSSFDRPAGAGELAYWAPQIALIGRSRVVDGIWYSMEAALYRAGNYYQLFLKRAPDWAGQQSWARVLLTSGEGAVRIGIAGSEEYRLRASVRFP